MKGFTSHLAGLVLSGALCAGAADSKDDSTKLIKLLQTSTVSLLKEGNARFAAGKPQAPNAEPARRMELAANGQEPLATILACSDSRDPVELMFDRGVGDLFVVRVAGNVAGVSETATIEVGYSRAELKGNRKTREITLSGGDIDNLKLNTVNAEAARITGDTRILNIDLPGGRSMHVPVDGGQQSNSFRSGDWNESGQITGQQLSFTYSDRFGSAYSNYGLVMPRVTLGLRDYDGWRSGLVRIGAKWQPADFWRVDVEAGNDIVENLDSIDNRVKLNYLSASVDHRFDSRWSAGGGLFLGKFDDGNRRKTHLPH